MRGADSYDERLFARVRLEDFMRARSRFAPEATRAGGSLIEGRASRKRHAAPSLPSDLGHVLAVDRHGLLVKVQAGTARGAAERNVAAPMLDEVARADERAEPTTIAERAFNGRSSTAC